VLAFMHCHSVFSLSLHAALPISFVFLGWDSLSPAPATHRQDGTECVNAHYSPSHPPRLRRKDEKVIRLAPAQLGQRPRPPRHARSEEHTSELQSRENLVCRLLLE